MKRIVVTGPAGAGKSELSSRLGERLGIRVVHLDTLFWKPGWVATPAAEFEALQRRELEAPEWIVDSQAGFTPEPGPMHLALLKFARNQWRYRTRVRGELLAELARERDGRRVVTVRTREDAAAFLDLL